MCHLKIASRLCLLTPILILFSLSAVYGQAARKPASAKSVYPQLEGLAHKPAPLTFDVQHYLIRTRFDRKTKTVFGDETISLKPLSGGLTEVALDAAGLQIDSATLDGTDTKLAWRQEKPDQLLIKLDRAYADSDTIAVHLIYRAVNPRRGVYFTPEGVLPDTKVRRPPQIWTQGEPEDNRYWFVGHDYPNDLATSEQYITTTAPGEIALANGKLLETIDNPDGTRTYHWRLENPHASYLTSFVVGEFVKIEDWAALPSITPDGPERTVPLEYYTYAGAEEAARKAYAQTPAMVRAFAAKLSYPFPFNKYAQVGVGYFSQFEGMENVTATTLADSSVLRYNFFRAPYELTDEARRDVTNLISHELAHSWFGDLVTCQDWSHIWLNEGLATFMEAAYQETLSGSAGYLREMRANRDLYLFEDIRYRRPIIYNRYRDPVQLFDSTTYKKGGFIMHMLRRQVGDEAFWAALNLYLTRHAHQNVVSADLQRAFEEKSGQKLDWFFQQWVYGAGYPELKVRYTYNPKTKQLALTVQQVQKPDATTPAVFRLPGVQLAIATAEGTRAESINITERTQTFTFPLTQAPRSVAFDTDERVLKLLDYPQQPGVE